MKYQWKLINQFTLPKWKRMLGFSISVQTKILDTPVQEGDIWVYPIEFVSYTIKWLNFTIKTVKL